jgi:hypothetical protein
MPGRDGAVSCTFGSGHDVSGNGGGSGVGDSTVTGVGSIGRVPGRWGQCRGVRVGDGCKVGAGFPSSA